MPSTQEAIASPIDLEADGVRGTAAETTAVEETATADAVPAVSVVGADAVEGTAANSQLVAFVAPQPSSRGASSGGFAIDAVAAWHMETHGENDVVCGDCNMPCQSVKSRLMSKGQGKFRCPSCGSTHSTKTWAQASSSVTLLLLRMENWSAAILSVIYTVQPIS